MYEFAYGVDFVFEVGEHAAVLGSSGDDYYHIKAGSSFGIEAYPFSTSDYYSFNTLGGHDTFLIEGGYFSASLMGLEADSVKFTILGGEFEQAIQGSFNADTFTVSGGIFHKGIMGNGGGDSLYLSGDIKSAGFVDMDLIEIAPQTLISFPKEELGTIYLSQNKRIINNGGAVALRTDFYNGQSDMVDFKEARLEGSPFLKIIPLSKPDSYLPAERIPVVSHSIDNPGLVGGTVIAGDYIYDLLPSQIEGEWDLALVGRVPAEELYVGAQTSAEQQVQNTVADFLGQTSLLNRKITARISKKDQQEVQTQKQVKGKKKQSSLSQFVASTLEFLEIELPKAGRIWSSASMASYTSNSPLGKSNTKARSASFGFESLESQGWYGSIFVGFMATPSLQVEQNFQAEDGSKSFTQAQGYLLSPYVLWEWSPIQKGGQENWALSLGLSSFQGELAYNSQNKKLETSHQWLRSFSGVSSNISASVPLSLLGINLPLVENLRLVPELGAIWTFYPVAEFSFADDSYLAFGPKESRVLRYALSADFKISAVPWCNPFISYVQTHELKTAPSFVAYNDEEVASSPLGDSKSLSFGLSFNPLENFEFKTNGSVLFGDKKGWQAEASLAFTW